MATSVDIAWVAGLLEGEGCFSISNQKCLSSGIISLVSTDYDTIVRFKCITKTSNMIQTARRNTKYWKTCYKILISGNLAIQWMMTIYPLMGIRRQEAIRNLLNRWKSSPGAGSHNKKRNR